MHHGYGILNRAAEVMDKKEKEEFKKYINDNNKFNPNIMYVSKKIFLQKNSSLLDLQHGSY